RHTRFSRDWSSDVCSSDLDIDRSIKLLRDRVGMPNLMIDAIPNDPEWDFPSLSPLLNEIRRERRVELLAEGFRWDDIARWAAADEVIVGQRPKGFKAAQIDRNPFHERSEERRVGKECRSR